MPAYKMLLHPADPECTLNPDELAEVLQGIGLLAAPRSLGDEHFYPVGENFLELVTFLGCSPAIELDPPDDPAQLAEASAAGRFCHAFITTSPRPRLRADPRTPAPRCQACRQPPDDWSGVLEQWLRQLPAAPWQCGSCGHSTDIRALPLRKTAGIATIWLELRGIHPFEAVPGTTMLDTLQSLSGAPWRTLYLQE